MVDLGGQGALHHAWSLSWGLFSLMVICWGL